VVAIDQGQRRIALIGEGAAVREPAEARGRCELLCREGRRFGYLCGGDCHVADKSANNQPPYPPPHARPRLSSFPSVPHSMMGVVGQAIAHQPACWTATRVLMAMSRQRFL